MQNEELHQLIDALLDGEISEADLIRLEAEMDADPASREAYYSRVELSTLLEMEAERTEAAGKMVKFPSGTVQWKRLGLVAAGIIAVAGSAWSGWMAGRQPQTTDSSGAPVAKTEPVANGFGVISETADAVWLSSRQHERGDLISAGFFELESGIVKLDMFSGVTVVMEGHAKFEVASSMEIKVHRGKLRAVVPEQAHGFRITTESGDLIDLGTEFAMDVTPEQTDLHVLDGEIEWRPSDAQVRRMKEGEAIRWTSTGKGANLKLESQSMADLENELAAHRQQQRKRWMAQVELRSNDPRLIAYFPMNQRGDWQRTLIDRGPNAHDASIVRALPSRDRWDHPAAALDLSLTGSRARLDLPGTYRSLTFMCWAKIDSLDKWYNSLFLTDGHELNEPHWQIMDDGRLFFSVKKQEWKSKEEPDKHIFYSPSIWDYTMSGKWIQIATTYDVENERVSHFINGSPISTERIPKEFLVENVTIGAASIGNWSEPSHRKDPHFAVRNLNGSIDEFAIYSAALTSQEIFQLYEAGKP